jgi:hypothetical protein
MNDYQMTEEDLFSLWGIFISLDSKRVNRLNLGQLFEQLNERDYSIIGPFLERLYELIDIKMPTQESIHKVDYGPHHAIPKNTY